MASCAICLDEDAKKEFLVTDCNHIFHMECLLQTKEINKNIIIRKNEFTILKCPICRKLLSIYNLTYKTFCCQILDYENFLQVKAIYNHISNLHLNKNYVFISGGYATALYSKLTNKNTQFQFTDIDIYYIDYNNLYENNSKHVYNTDCKTNISNIKDVGKGKFLFNKESNIFKDYNIIYLDNINYSNDSNNNINIIENSILKTFKGIDLSCCKVAFIMKGDYIKFFIHSDYHRKGVNFCTFSTDRIEKRIVKYKHRGYDFNKNNYTKCCNYDYI